MRGGALGRRVGRGGDARTLGGLGRTREREGERDAGPAGKKEQADWGGVTRLGPWRLGCGFGLGKQELAMGRVLG